ncbi:hypothetical protein COW36_17740 [bacterium (Candidatus Blackallbacteria) CG17_big_fil_post_rev_8_21_14_2_50_48_46]|uniref:DUF983 domain-containing protein n=1 Tax=bacterium (Candidatus Blackallbacteria) CG17_big_fil_post_rev_8_21_14_2_50_48_46 TaxID=2014261 RepID=A0A2M7G1P7_9BACT|nr:MAG: hypothetical protein COW64_00985 [bacterium (Candidatus Blackallbacteria) CG18_big_fil_WC_8_21_14_2_50_49_26]PIW15260.1 MAG: hypothetical protein COW36_17740 [bacterium (Candidatus Blackallbacteria) CG17_big_fil_post_rev_8_21_14_2_50_48_46]PIW45231.1 MAG: hypothetical protein COW20_21275 [bacterium (Candidatus Blackallbacteria) CG13_big_fil_rev_8_21_14_2_50_49_14]
MRDLPQKTESPGLLPRLKVVGRCLSLACPRCGWRPIAGLFSFQTRCPGCDLLIDKGNGFLLGALPISYVVFIFVWLLPVSAAWIMKALTYPVAFGLIGVGAVVIPLLIYNYCKLISLALYYFFMVAELTETSENG